MNVTIDIPQDIQQRLEAHAGALAQRALEAIAVEAYRTRLVTAAEVQRMLKLPSRLATDAFLKRHEAYLHYTQAEFAQDLRAIDLVLAHHDNRL